MGILAEIIAHKRTELRCLPRLTERPFPDVRDVTAALRRPPGAPLRLIAEVKLRSPSFGNFSQVLDPLARAQSYVAGGAALVSVLTDAHYFGGSFEHLSAVRRAVPLPVLCKDFVIDTSQIDVAFNAGADAVLLIVRCLDNFELRELVRAVHLRNMTPLIEVTTEAELERALRAGARVVGVNARDLDSLELDRERAARVLTAIPDHVIAVHLSGVRDVFDVARIAASRAAAVLVGESLMRVDDPAPVLTQFMRAAG